MVFFSQSYNVFISGLIISIISIIIGILLRLFRIGFKIQTLINKFKREKVIVKEKVIKEEKFVKKERKVKK